MCFPSSPHIFISSKISLAHSVLHCEFCFKHSILLAEGHEDSQEAPLVGRATRSSQFLHPPSVEGEVRNENREPLLSFPTSLSSFTCIVPILKDSLVLYTPYILTYIHRYHAITHRKISKKRYHYIALHCITVHCLHYIALHYTALHCIALHCIYIGLHCYIPTSVHASHTTFVSASMLYSNFW